MSPRKRACPHEQTAEGEQAVGLGGAQSGAPPQPHRRRRSSPARHDGTQSRSALWEQTAVGRTLSTVTPPHHNALIATTARRAGRERTALSPFTPSPCITCPTASAACVRERATSGSDAFAPSRPIDSTTLPTRPSCACPAIIATRRQPAGTPSPRSQRTSAHKDWFCNYAQNPAQSMARSGVSTARA